MEDLLAMGCMHEVNLWLNIRIIFLPSPLLAAPPSPTHTHTPAYWILHGTYCFIGIAKIVKSIKIDMVDKYYPREHLENLI